MLFQLLAFIILVCATSPISDVNLEKPAKYKEISAAANPIECAKLIENIESKPEMYFGWMESPENFENSEIGPKLNIFYYGRKAEMRNPIIFFNGGPGEDSHGSLTGLEKSIKSFSMNPKKFNFIFMDQRGTGCSSKYPDFAKIPPSETARVRFYGSRGIVHDSEILRKKLLGDRRWKIYGQSFGAHIVHQYVALFPDSVSRAYAHGIAISTANGIRKVNTTFAEHRVQRDYFKKYPEDKLRIEALIGFLNNRDFCMTVMNTYCGFEILEKVFLKRLSLPSTWLQLNESLAKIVQLKPSGGLPNGKIVVSELRHHFESIDGSIKSNLDTFVTSLILHFDVSVIGFGSYECENVIRGVERIYGIDRKSLGFTSCDVKIQKRTSESRTDVYVNYYQLLNESLNLQKFKMGLIRLNSNPEIDLPNQSQDRFFLYSGELDTIVPKETFQEELKAVGKLLKYRNFLNSGHDGPITERQIYEDLLN